MATLTLRDGSLTDDPRLDRLVQFDEKSRDFPVSEVVPGDLKSKTWRLDERLDQNEADEYLAGGCVGHGFSHRVAAEPIEVGKIDHPYALNWYLDAQDIDEWPGSARPDASPRNAGTSVLAGAKVGKARGLFDEYRWCFSVEDVLRALSHEGPVVVGTWWDQSMFHPDKRGFISPDGNHAGGHCYLIRGVRLRRDGNHILRITNSWGKGWGKNGEAFITVRDFEPLLLQDGEAVVPREVRAPKPSTTRTRAALGHWWFNRYPFGR